MLKKLEYVFILFLMISIVPIMNVSAATEKRVNTESDLLEALKDKDVDTIILEKDIDTTDKINITRDVTIDGNNHTLKYSGDKSKTEWNGIYVLHVYKSNATIKNIKLTGGNAGLLVNGSNVTFVGTIDVSGNGFGGIELSQGKGVTDTSKLTFLDNAKVVNTTDSKNAPTFWVPEDSKDAIIVMNGMTVTIKSGEELSNEEFNDLFTDKENPKTGSLENMYLISGLTGLGSTIIILRKRFV